MRNLSSIAGLFLAVGIVACHPGPAQEQASTVAALSQPGPTFTVPASEIPKHWTVIGYGDTRFTDPTDTKDTNPIVRRWLVNQIAAEHPDALLISGDLPLKGAVSNDYAVFKTETEIWRTSHLRVYPALGNHELNGGEALGLGNWWAAFPELNQRRWYSVSFGNAWFLNIDSNAPLTAGSAQQAWIADQLKALPQAVQFVFITMHHPVVGDDGVGNSHNVRPNEAALGQFLSSVAPTLKARITVLCGHVHNYERFQKDGVTYLVAGGGAAKPYKVDRNAQDLFKGTDEVNYHYITFRFDGKTVHAEMHRLANPDGAGPDTAKADTAKPGWEVKDSFEIVPVK
jgi:3',5'-cyclic AMP phosphodiesterase CpdA